MGMPSGGRAPRYPALPFWTLCLFLLSQAWMIPVIAIGPSWAVWPRFADATSVLFVLAAATTVGVKLPTSDTQKLLFRLLVACYLAFIVSYVVVNLGMSGTTEAQGTDDGIYYLFRMAQFTAILWATTRVPLTPGRQRLLAIVVGAAYVFVCGMCLLTFLRVIPPELLVAHLPHNRDAGPWNVYLEPRAAGKGSISYNHAYVTAQIILLLGLRLHLTRKKNPFIDTGLLLLGLAACFVSGSRAGLAAMLLFSMFMFLRSLIYIPIAAVLMLLGSLLISPEAMTSSDLSQAAERQTETLDPGKVSAFQARIEIWTTWMEDFRSDPTIWIIGRGFGSARSEGKVAHMLYLTVLGELGIIGLAAYLYLIFVVMRELFRREEKPQPVMWALMVLLLASLTQDTFYPVPAMGHYLGFVFCAVALALRPREETAAAPAMAWRGMPGFPGMPQMRGLAPGQPYPRVMHPQQRPR